MRKTSVIALLSAIVLVGSLMGCKKSPPPPVSELIAKVWTASKVEENSVTVYTRGATAQIRDYTSWKLDLSKAPAATYTEYDKTVSVGQYSVPNDQTLTLTNMNPSFTGDNGTVTFTINSIDESNLVITKTKTSLKTGNTTNKYTLTSP